MKNSQHVGNLKFVIKFNMPGDHCNPWLGVMIRYEGGRVAGQFAQSCWLSVPVHRRVHHQACTQHYSAINRLN